MVGPMAGMRAHMIFKLSFTDDETKLIIGMPLVKRVYEVEGLLICLASDLGDPINVSNKQMGKNISRKLITHLMKFVYMRTGLLCIYMACISNNSTIHLTSS